jgi:hypothetical protein
VSRKVLLIGSIPLGTARAVFDAVGTTLDGLVRRIPDGENGERLDWVAWQSSAFARIPFVDAVEPAEAGVGAVPSSRRLPHFRVRPGFPPTTVRFGTLGYLDTARRSFADFRAAAAAGGIPAGCRLQIGIATPLSVVGQFVDIGFQAAIEPSYERALVEEIDAIADAVPPRALAIQWNLATELCIVEGHRRVHFGKVMDGVMERLVRLCERVPVDAEVGLHFCYDDFLLNGFPMPDTLDRLVDLANGVLASVARPVAWIHLPVRHDIPAARYLAPLRRLALPPETELYLGLLHPADGLEGAERRIALARREVADFGIACACGFGRISATAAGSLLELHRRAATIG